MSAIELQYLLTGGAIGLPIGLIISISLVQITKQLHKKGVKP